LLIQVRIQQQVQQQKESHNVMVQEKPICSCVKI